MWKSILRAISEPTGDFFTINVEFNYFEDDLSPATKTFVKTFSLTASNIKTVEDVRSLCKAQIMATIEQENQNLTSQDQLINDLNPLIDSEI